MVVIGGIDLNLRFTQASISLRYSIKSDDEIRHYHEKDPNNKERINDIETKNSIIDVRFSFFSNLTPGVNMLKLSWEFKHTSDSALTKKSSHLPGLISKPKVLDAFSILL